MMYCLNRRAPCAPLRTYNALGALSPAAGHSALHGSSQYTRTLHTPSLYGSSEPRVHATPSDTVALLEAAAIALGAAALTPERLRVARAADRALQACTHDVTAAAGLARLFHHTLLTACPNRHMLDLITREAGAPHRQRGFDLRAEELNRVVADHEAILDMIAAGAPSSDLERSLRRHASNSSLCALGAG